MEKTPIIKEQRFWISGERMMNSYNIEIGCKEYVIKCMCGEDAVEYCRNMTTAIRMFREQGWTMSSMRTLCPKCNARSKPVTERPTIEQNDERGI